MCDFKVRYVTAFLMDDGNRPRLTLGKIYEAVLSKSKTYFTIKDDDEHEHSFEHFTSNFDEEFKTKDYFNIVV
jgi:hypothetical protein